MCINTELNVMRIMVQLIYYCVTDLITKKNRSFIAILYLLKVDYL